MRKNNLFAVSILVVALTLCFSVAVAKSENANGANGNPNLIAPAKMSVSATPSASVNATTSPVVSSNKGQITAQEHRSTVANFVQSLVKVADREKGGIGEQVRVIAQQQNQATASTTAAMEKIQTRSKVKTFLIGTDYKNAGQLRSEMVQTRNRIKQLIQLSEQTKNAGDKTELQTQIQTMEEQQAKIENFLNKNENKFSLFGWLVKFFNK